MSQREKLNLIVELSIPSILAQLSSIIMFFIDMAMVGHLGAQQSASIGLVESSTWVFFGLTGACSMGFSVQVAHAIGANDFKRARRILRQALTCCIIFSCFLSISTSSQPSLPTDRKERPTRISGNRGMHQGRSPHCLLTSRGVAGEYILPLTIEKN